MHDVVKAAKSHTDKSSKKAKDKELAKAEAALSKPGASIESQLTALLRFHIANELPFNVNRAKRAGARRPLTAFMAGASPKAPSKIFAVCEGVALYPYTSHGASSEILSDRIAARYGLTWVQLYLLREHVLGRYRGVISDHRQMRIARCVGVFAKHSSGTVLATGDSTCIDMLRRACEKLGTWDGAVPLAFILDPRVTNLLLLIQLNAALTMKRNKRPL